MTDWKHYDTTLELVEALATHEGWISSEGELSEQFDQLLEETDSRDLEEDEVALNEAFSIYADSLCKDGRIHAEQYSNYVYVGKLS